MSRLLLRKKLLIFSIILAVFIFGFFNRNLLTVKYQTTHFQNISCISDKKNEVFNLEGSNILTFDESKFQAKIKKKYLCVSEVKVNRNFPSTVTIEILGRKPVAKIRTLGKQPILDISDKEATPSSQSAILENLSEEDLGKLYAGGGKNFLIDLLGLIYSEDTLNSDVPLIGILSKEIKPGDNFEDWKVNNALEIFKRLSTLGVKFKTPTIEGADLLVLSDNPQKMLFSLDSDLERQLASLQLILQKSKINSNEKDPIKMELIDLRFDKPIVVYAPKK